MADRLRTKVGAVELKNSFGINGAQSGLDIAR